MKKSIFVFLLGAILMGASGCGQEGNTGLVSLPNHSNSEQSSSVFSAGNDYYPEGATSEPFFPKPYSVSDLPEENLYDMGEVMEYKGWQFQVNSVSVSKSLDSFPLENIDYSPDVMRDESGVLQNDYSYVFVDVSVTNLQPEDKELILGSLNLVDPSFKMDADIKGFDEFEHSPHGMRAYYFTIKSSETLTRKCVYIVPDDYLKGKQLLLCPNLQGQPITLGIEYAEILPFFQLEW